MRRPIYLTGAVRPEYERYANLGFMRTPNMGNRQPNGLWAADTGCYSAAGVRDFDLGAYLAWLKAQDSQWCLFATAPDRVGDPETTLELSLPVLPMIRALDYPAALVAQDGLEHMGVPWDAFDVLFIGGSTDWKLGIGAESLIREAKHRNLWVHMGRVNSGKRYAYAASLGCNSVDGTYLAFGPGRNLPRVLSWITAEQEEAG